METTAKTIGTGRYWWARSGNLMAQQWPDAHPTFQAHLGVLLVTHRKKLTLVIRHGNFCFISTGLALPFFAISFRRSIGRTTVNLYVVCDSLNNFGRPQKTSVKVIDYFRNLSSTSRTYITNEIPIASTLFVRVSTF